ncbi:MAG: SGNH/GDSL hydrolase family protein [Bilifractor sp.]
MKLKNLKINFLGDSITEGCGTSDPKNVYWNLLAMRDGVIARGYGIGGTRIARQQTKSPDPKWDQYFRSRVQDMDPDADVIVVFGGTNDYGHGDAPLGSMDDRTDDTFYGALHLLYLDLLERYPDARLLVMTPLHRIGEKSHINEMGNPTKADLETYVNIIQKVAAYYAIPVVDLYRTSGLQPEVPMLRERYNPDGLHPNDAGNERIYRRLKEALLSMQ